MDKDPKLKLIMLMRENEKLISELYSVFAEHFPEDKLLWTKLEKAEIKHSETIDTLYRQVNELTVFVDEVTTTTLAIQASVNYTEGLIEQARTGKMTRINALALARDLEKSVLEKNYFTFFKSSSFNFHDLMQELLDDTAEHIRMLESRWEMVRKRGL